VCRAPEAARLGMVQATDPGGFQVPEPTRTRRQPQSPSSPTTGNAEVRTLGPCTLGAYFYISARGHTPSMRHRARSKSNPRRRTRSPNAGSPPHPVRRQRRDRRASRTAAARSAARPR